MICNLLSKFLIPVRDCSVDTEPTDGDNDAKLWALPSPGPHYNVSVDRLVCDRAFLTLFLQIQVRGMTNVLGENFAAYAATLT